MLKYFQTYIIFNYIYTFENFLILILILNCTEGTNLEMGIVFETIVIFENEWNFLWKKKLFRNKCMENER